MKVSTGTAVPAAQKVVPAPPRAGMVQSDGSLLLGARFLHIDMGTYSCFLLANSVLLLEKAMLGHMACHQGYAVQDLWPPAD